MSTGETDVDKLIAELWAAGDGRSEASRILSDSKSARNRAAGEPNAYYEYTRPEQTCEHRAADLLTRLRSEIANHERVHASHQRLVRELDVILNGEAGAAPQASLCDVVDQVRRLRSQGAVPAIREAASPPPTQGGGNSRIRELLETALELFEMDDECNTPGTDAWAWTYHVRDALKAVSPPASAAQQEGDASKEAIGDALEGMMLSFEAEYRSMSEADLQKRWFYRYEPDKSLSWNIYSFTDMLALYRGSCRRWEEMHNGHCCVVERVRDKYLLPKIAEFANTIRGAAISPAVAAERARVIEECAKVADELANQALARRDASDDDDVISVAESHRVIAAYTAAQIRALGKGGADGR